MGGAPRGTLAAQCDRARVGRRRHGGRGDFGDAAGVAVRAERAQGVEGTRGKPKDERPDQTVDGGALGVRPPGGFRKR
jgi:hypothetical protein